MCDLLQFGNISRCVVKCKQCKEIDSYKGRVLNVTETPQETEDRKCHACRITINHCTMIKLKNRVQSIADPKKLNFTSVSTPSCLAEKYKIGPAQ